MTYTLDRLRYDLTIAQATAAHHTLKQRHKLAKLWRDRARALRRRIARRELARPPPLARSLR